MKQTIKGIKRGMKDFFVLAKEATKKRNNIVSRAKKALDMLNATPIPFFGVEKILYVLTQEIDSAVGNQTTIYLLMEWKNKGKSKAKIVQKVIFDQHQKIRDALYQEIPFNPNIAEYFLLNLDGFFEQLRNEISANSDFKDTLKEYEGA